MHAIVFKAAAVDAQSGLPGLLLRSRILSSAFVSG